MHHGDHLNCQEYPAAVLAQDETICSGRRTAANARRTVSQDRIEAMAAIVGGFVFSAAVENFFGYYLARKALVSIRSKRYRLRRRQLPSLSSLPIRHRSNSLHRLLSIDIAECADRTAHSDNSGGHCKMLGNLGAACP
jgi:hypothetical protein